MMGMLNSLRRFFIPALSPAMFNVATIVVRVHARAGDATHRLATDRRHRDRYTARRRSDRWRMQWPVLRREGWRYQPSLDSRDPDCGKCCG